MKVLTKEMIDKMAFSLVAQEPAVNYYSRGYQPPIGHRADCNPRHIESGTCFCMEAERAGYEVKFRRGKG